MSPAEQVKARIIEVVTGVVPTVHAEVGDLVEDAQSARVIYKHTLPVQDAQSAPNLTPEQHEAFEALMGGFPNVLIYRAFKTLEARVAELEAGNGAQ